MVHFNSLAVAAILGSAASVIAAPTGTLAERSSCTFSGSAGAASAKAAKTSCSTITLNSLAVPAGTTLDLTGLKSGTKVIFEGTTTFGYKEWEGPLVSISGTSITVTGASGAVLDGSGSKYWDGKGSNGGKTKPKFFAAHKMISSSISNLEIKNAPVQVFSINNSQDLTLTSVTVDNSAGDSLGGHNTDAFDIGDSTGITITGANVKNQDDCVAINSGENIVVSGSTCSGGHGLSIGSVGGRDNNVVKNVTFKNNKVVNSQNGVRIKTVYGATGSVSGVTYEDITLSGITNYGIVIEQDYQNGSPTGTPTTGVPITGLVVKNVKGTVTSSGVDNYILCGSGSCSNWTFSGNSVTGGGKTKTCKNIPSGSGAKC